MTKYIIGEIFSSGGETLYKNHSDQTVIEYDMALAGDLLFIKTTLTFDRLLPVKENFLTRQVFKVSLFFCIEY